jgi:hypothetical protein
MLRFQLDRPLMVKRWRKEWKQHGRDFGNCHCGLGAGTMRKTRPYAKPHSPNRCSICDIYRMEKRQNGRRERYGARLSIEEGRLLAR